MQLPIVPLVLNTATALSVVVIYVLSFYLVKNKKEPVVSLILGLAQIPFFIHAGMTFLGVIAGLSALIFPAVIIVLSVGNIRNQSASRAAVQSDGRL